MDNFERGSGLQRAVMLQEEEKGEEEDYIRIFKLIYRG
jgi:hypothetical protein